MARLNLEKSRALKSRSKNYFRPIPLNPVAQFGMLLRLVNLRELSAHGKFQRASSLWRQKDRPPCRSRDGTPL